MKKQLKSMQRQDKSTYTCNHQEAEHNSTIHVSLADQILELEHLAIMY